MQTSPEQGMPTRRPRHYLVRVAWDLLHDWAARLAKVVRARPLRVWAASGFSETWRGPSHSQGPPPSG